MGVQVQPHRLLWSVPRAVAERERRRFDWQVHAVGGKLLLWLLSRHDHHHYRRRRRYLTTSLRRYQGGHRTVGLAHWPSRIVAGSVTSALSSTLDYFPTVASLAGLALPTDRSYDGTWTDTPPHRYRRDHHRRPALWPPAHHPLPTLPEGIDLSPMFFASTRPAEGASNQLTAAIGSGDPGAELGHTELFHPLSGACGDGDLDGMRQGQYKAVWASGGQKGCLSDSAECIHYNLLSPLLFDLVSPACPVMCSCLRPPIPRPPPLTTHPSVPALSSSPSTPPKSMPSTPRRPNSPRSSQACSRRGLRSSQMSKRRCRAQLIGRRAMKGAPSTAATAPTWNARAVCGKPDLGATSGVGAIGYCS